MDLLKHKKLKSFILMLFLTATCICFDTVKADDFASPSDQLSSLNTFNADYSFVNEDECTFEMLGNNNLGIIVHDQNVRNTIIGRNQNCYSAKRTQSYSILYASSDNDSSSFRYYLSESIYSYDDCTDMAALIKCIHDKDGKKTI